MMMDINNEYGIELYFNDITVDTYNRNERISNVIMNLDTKELSYVMTHGKDNEKIDYLLNLVGRMLLERAI